MRTMVPHMECPIYMNNWIHINTFYEQTLTSLLCIKKKEIYS